MKKTLIEAQHIGKYFYSPKKVQVLNDISFKIDEGEFVSVIGKSGCGKSTLLYILSTMDTEYEGDLKIDGVATKKKTPHELAHIRNEKIGFVFQFHYLLTEFSVIKNVMFPGIKLGKYSEEEVEHQAYERLKLLGIENEALKNSNQLSGGQKQRVAIARALINKPKIIMADEPTGNLDEGNSELVFGIFKEICAELNQTILVVTHDNDFANRTDRIIELSDGEILSDGPPLIGIG
jgi:lipoprotein-releasing system ATP-binding protein